MNTDAFDQGFASGLSKEISETVRLGLSSDARAFAAKEDLNPDWSGIDRSQKRVQETIKGVYGSVSGQDQQRIMDTISSDPEFKKILPELAFEDLAHRFDRIPHKGAAISQTELKDYAAGCNPQGLEKVAINYAVNHFDRIRQLDPKADGITQAAIGNGIKQLGALEKEKENLGQSDAVRAQPTLSFLQDNFDKIHLSKEFDGISAHELETYRAHLKTDDPNLTKAANAEYQFPSLRYFDTTDGGPAWYKLWLGNGNSETVTHRDINAGLAEAQRVPARVAEIDQQLKSWSE